MTQQIVSVNDGYKLTVSDLKGNPLFIPTRIVALLANQFIEEFLLRDAGPNPNGLVSFRESSPIFLADEPGDLVEFEEIPVAAGQRGEPRIAVGTKKGLGVRISKEMFDENQIGEVQRQIIQLVNTFVRSRARALRALLQSPAIPTIAAGAAWDTANGKPRRDIANAMEVVASASVSGDADNEDSFGFTADTVALSTTLTPVLMDNDNFLSVYKDTLSTEDIRYTGKLSRDIMGMVGAQSRYFPGDRVLVVERGTVGFYSDTRPLQSTPLYPEGNGPNGGATESWRSDTTGKRVMGIDQPLAACWVTGVVTP